MASYPQASASAILIGIAASTKIKKQQRIKSEFSYKKSQQMVELKWNLKILLNYFKSLNKQ